MPDLEVLFQYACHISARIFFLVLEVRGGDGRNPNQTVYFAHVVRYLELYLI